jgi:nucleoside-diphosphate-sugar epimerase
VRLLVLGATGFLGAHVRRRAMVAGAEVVTAARSALPDSPVHLRIDLAEDSVAAITARLSRMAPDVVVNCAGAIAGSPGVMAAANITGVANLVRAMLDARTAGRLVHVGSAAEYGAGVAGFPVTERDRNCPVGIYGATKLGGTRLVELGRVAGLDAVVLRVFNPIGPGSPPGSLPGRLAAEVARAVADGSDVRLGPLDTVRDFIDARDVADAVLAAATAPTLPSPVLNIGTGQGTETRALARELAEIGGYLGTIHESAAASERSAEVPWQQADISRACHDLGWQPTRTLTTSLRDLWEANR